MAQFPKAEGDIVVLAQELKSGLTANTTVFPTPPVPTTELTTLMTALTAAESAAVAAQAAAEAAINSKLDALSAMAEAMKKDLRYAENTVGNDDEKLKLLGWGARKEKTATPPPGQTLELVVVAQGEGWLDLTWKSPVDGGKVAAYKVQRRERPAGAWEDAATAMERSAHIDNQVRGKEWEWRVVAANKAGDGMPSNIVMTVL